MMKQQKNLNTLKLTEFTSENTIYIRDNKNPMKPLHLCQFVSFDRSKSVVTGKIISVDEDYRSGEIGKTISARYDSCALYGNATDEIDRSYYRWFDSSLYAMHPLEEHKIVENDLHVSKHPSYGMARFSRINHNGTSLFGSSIQNKQTITLTISRGEHDRNYMSDMFYGNQELIEIEMSQSQFAELITSFNMGSGVPVTIRHINHERMPQAPFLSKADIFKNEFAAKMQNFSVDLKKNLEIAIEILKNKPTIGKGDRDVILKSIQSSFSEISSNIPFFNGQFIEAMETTVTEAKAEIEAFVENKIRSAGLDALGFNKEKDSPLLDKPKS